MSLQVSWAVLLVQGGLIRASVGGCRSGPCGYADPGWACMFGGWLTGDRWPQLFSMWLLILQLASPGLFSWRQGSKRKCGSVQGFLRLRLRTTHTSFLPHSFGQHKLQGQPRSWEELQSHMAKGVHTGDGWKFRQFSQLISHIKKLSILPGSYKKSTLICNQ